MDLRCELTSVDAVDFVKQSSSIQKVADIIREYKLNQTLVEVTKLLRLIFNIPGPFASCERSSCSLKCLNNYMRCSQREEMINNLVFISINRYLFKKIKVEHCTDTFYRKVIDEFAKKKRTIELI